MTGSHSTSQIKHIFELRKLIVMIISINFLCWRSNFANEWRVSKGFQTPRRKHLKPGRRRQSGFIVFEGLET